MSRTPDERNSLVETINRLWFLEDGRVGWLKVATFPELLSTLGTCRFPEDKKAVEEYIHSQGMNGALRRPVIGAFVAEWILQSTPEDMIPDVRQDDFNCGDRADALRVIDQILSVTALDPEGVIGWLDPDQGNEEGNVSYSQLRAWFADYLFDPDTAVYYIHDPEQNADSFRSPHVIGMDSRVIAMFWLA